MRVANDKALVAALAVGLAGWAGPCASDIGPYRAPGSRNGAKPYAKCRAERRAKNKAARKSRAKNRRR